MLFEFKTKKLAKVYEKGEGSYPDAVKKAFVKKVNLIKRAKNENDLRILKSNHFEKLKGRKAEYSIRLNDQYRLIFEILKNGQYKIILINKISDHYS